LPEPGEIGEVALNLGLVLPMPAVRMMKPTSLGGLSESRICADGGALLHPRFFGDAHLAHAGHHHQDAAGDGEIGAEGRALGADAFLDDLHDDLIAAAQAALNRRAIAAGHFAADGFLHLVTARPK
jgi:hypothetical protein